MSDGLGENPAVGPSGSDGLGENPAVGPSGSDGLGKNLLSASARRAPTDSGRISCREKDVVQIMFSRKPIPVPSPTIRSCIPFCEKKFFAPVRSSRVFSEQQHDDDPPARFLYVSATILHCSYKGSAGAAFMQNVTSLFPVLTRGYDA